MKIFIVKDSFHGTDADCSCDTVSSVWLDENIAKAVAASGYQNSVDEYEVNENETVPEYAKDHYEAVLRLQKRGKKDISGYDIEKEVNKMKR
jgi:hypothetical protein